MNKNLLKSPSVQLCVGLGGAIGYYWADSKEDRLRNAAIGKLIGLLIGIALSDESK